MFDTDPFAKRERALEDEFFHRVDEKLRQDLRKSMQSPDSPEALADAIGLDDQELAQHLLGEGISSTTLVALTLVPSVFVAWADGDVTADERKAVLEAANSRGIGQGHPAYKLLQGWLQETPPQSLWDAWKEYASAAGHSLSDQNTRRLARQIIRQATWVAEASGGFLGMGKISKQEQQVLDDVKATLA